MLLLRVPGDAVIVEIGAGESGAAGMGVAALRKIVGGLVKDVRYGLWLD